MPVHILEKFGSSQGLAITLNRGGGQNGKSKCAPLKRAFNLLGGVNQGCGLLLARDPGEKAASGLG